jgi:hypothetical protein
MWHAQIDSQSSSLKGFLWTLRNDSGPKSLNDAAYRHSRVRIKAEKFSKYLLK